VNIGKEDDLLGALSGAAQGSELARRSERAAQGSELARGSKPLRPKPQAGSLPFLSIPLMFHPFRHMERERHDGDHRVHTRRSRKEAGIGDVGAR
jgi:hypothetical protein